MRLALRHTDEPAIDPEVARSEDLLCVSIAVERIKELYLAFQHAGVTFCQTLRTQPYGIRDFIVEDLHGNRLGFFEARPVDVLFQARSGSH